MNLTESESSIFAMLKRKKSVSLDELMKNFDGSRHSLTVRMKYLSAKVSQEGWIITNTGGTGRGNKAVYSIEKKF
jgi:hypothetical protein